MQDSVCTCKPMQLMHLLPEAMLRLMLSVALRLLSYLPYSAGTWAEYVAVDESILVLAPKSRSLSKEMGAVPCVSLTAFLVRLALSCACRQASAYAVVTQGCPPAESCDACKQGMRAPSRPCTAAKAAGLCRPWMLGPSSQGSVCSSMQVPEALAAGPSSWCAGVACIVQGCQPHLRGQCSVACCLLSTRLPSGAQNTSLCQAAEPW